MLLNLMEQEKLGDRTIWTMAYTLGGGNLPLAIMLKSLIPMFLTLKILVTIMFGTLLQEQELVVDLIVVMDKHLDLLCNGAFILFSDK